MFLDQIFEVLKNGLWRDFPEVKTNTTALSDMKTKWALQFLRDYGFVEIEGIRVRLNESVVRFLNRIEKVEAMEAKEKESV